MRRPAKRSSSKLSADSQHLVTFAQAIAQASSRLEERAWLKPLDALLNKLLRAGNQGLIDTALDHLFKADLDAYDVLIEAVEAGSEATTLEHDGQDYDVQLLVLPVLAWTRFAIASGPIAGDLQNAIAAHLHAHILAKDARLALAPSLFSIEQLPRMHADVFALTRQLGQSALKNTPVQLRGEQPPTAAFLADTRYAIAAVVLPAGGALFHWQESEQQSHFSANKTAAFDAWTQQVTPIFTRLLPGCNVELLLPQAYFFGCREADKHIRPASIRAADYFLTQTLDIASSELHASIGGFSEDINGQIDEYRIGFSIGNDPTVVYGTVWPLYEQESGEDLPMMIPGGAGLLEGLPASPLQQILATLRECGIVQIKHHSERFTMEFCDDCGAPLFPDREGELVHAEMPEDTPPPVEHFH
ncbi:hypothetical protein HFRIS_010389 [Herbaspirillum frisingense GSF30]|uniref:DUF2863 family protein n=1 Tax=Herbaspirillum frisingense GSF30 TaxID=864073 RepID=A0AAI9N413_9BURK|nr:DUF2863 family protein [Herbaspirillum frisingense]EOA04777.1 hypothetical protein HFRIS_010389 [Herbaspirillum frisingense GSF30]